MENTRIDTQQIAGETCLILPSNVSASALTLAVDTDASSVITVTGAASSVLFTAGVPLDLPALCGTGSPYQLTFQWRSGDKSSSLHLRVLTSEKINAMYLVSDDPISHGRTWVEASADKSNKATGAMVLQTCDGTAVYNSELTQIKGRGNSTWLGEKKPYQIKLADKTDLLQTGKKANKAKTWLLLANMVDATLMRNTVCLGLGGAMSMNPAIESTPVDLYYDGEYRGSYLLTEKVEINSGRIDITDMEKLNENANPQCDDLLTLPSAKGYTANGATYFYCDNMKNPENITGGYLLEMETAQRVAEEKCYFATSRGNFVVVKSPECCSKEQMDYIASLYQQYEDAVYSDDGVNPTTGKAYSEYVDLDSTVQCYLVNELSKNLDSFRTSAYLYKDADSDIMTMGPLWDYDLGFDRDQLPYDELHTPENFYTVRNRLASALYRHADFRLAVKAAYTQQLYPLVKQVLLSDDAAVSESGTLHSISYYTSLLESSAVCDSLMWRGDGTSETYLDNIDYLRSYLSARADWLLNAYEQWSADSYEAMQMFDDVGPSAWYFNEVEQAVRLGLMRGVTQMAFEPTAVASRAQVVQVLYNMEKPLSSDFTCPYTDVKLGVWYSAPVNWAYTENVVEGYPDNTFRPNNNISRQELVVLLYRYVGSPAFSDNNLLEFTDEDSVQPFATTAMRWAVANKVITGYPDGTLKPFGKTLRSELSAVMLRFNSYLLGNQR